MKFNFWIFDATFRKFDQKTLKSEKNQTFEKVIFDAKNVLLGWNLLLAAILWPENLRKNAFSKILKILRSYDFFIIRQNRDWLRGLSLKTVPTLNRKTWWCCPLKIHSEPERLGQVHFDDMAKRTNFVLSYL